MPSVRTPINRATRSRVTDQAKEVFARAIALRSVYQACVRNDVCRASEVNQHCAECAKFLDLHLELDRLLGVKPWDTSPLDADSADPPDYIRRDPLKAKDWRKAWAMRCEISKSE